MILTLTLILLFLIVAGSNWWFGLWSNLLMLVNTLLAALVATSFYVNLAYLLFKQDQSYMLLWDFIALWILFAATFIVLRGITECLSSMRLKFDTVTEMIGRSLLSLAIAGVFVCFVSFTLQVAPLPPKLFSKKATSPKPITAEEFFSSFDRNRSGLFERNPERLGPDQAWVSFIKFCSKGSLSYTAEETRFFPEFKGFEDKKEDSKPVTVRIFDLNDFFFTEASLRRTVLSSREILRVPYE